VGEPNAQITWLLEEIEELTRLGLRRNGDPERNEYGGLVILNGAQRSRRIPRSYRLVSHRDLKAWLGRLRRLRCSSTSFEMTNHLLRDRLRGFSVNFTAASRTERVRNAWPWQLQIIVDFSHRAHG